MKTLMGSLVLGLSIGFVGWSFADPPADQEEPPVRLKKKKKTTPDKPEAQPEKPEPRPEPMKKPKLDEDAELDPRDDVKMPRGEEPAEDEIIKRIVRNTRLSEEKLANRETGEGTRKLQDEVIKDIDRLLEQQKQNQQNPQDQKNENANDSQPSGQDKNQQRTAQEREERRKRRMSGQQSASRNQGGQQQGQPQGGSKPGQGEGNGTNPGGGATGSAKADPKDPEKKFDLWGHLPEKERALMNKEMEQRFMEKYDELTKQYYRTIAEKSRRK